MRQWIIALALWLARSLGWQPDPCPLRHLPDVRFIESAREVVDQVDRAGGPSSDYKHRMAIVAMTNRHPQARTRDLSLAIEMALQERG